MNLKLIGAVLIVASCASVGFSMAAGYRREEQALRQLIGALDYMACELQYRLPPLPDLCRMAGQERQGYIGKVLTALAQELESQLRPDVESCMAAALGTVGEIPKGTREALLLLGGSLGRFDVEGQLNGLENVRAFCRSQVQSLASGRDNRLRSYQTLGICTGAALAILFV